MPIKKQHSRISHHTVTTSGSAFTIPSGSIEDFTLGTWDITDLALSEIGVNEGDGTVAIRVGSEIKEFVMSGSISGGISAVVDDTSPQLGGDLNLNGQDITGTGNISINTTSTATPILLLTATNDSSDASPIIDLKRNSSSPSNGDYLGQIKFKGENDNNQEVVYAKITGKISDVTDTTEDGLIEFATKRAGANVINARLTSTDLKLINGTGLEVDGTISAGDLNATGAVTASNLYVENELWTIDLIDYQTVDFYAPYYLTIDSYDTVVSVSAVTFLDDGASYTTGSLIAEGSKITVTSTSATVINLNTSR